MQRVPDLSLRTAMTSTVSPDAHRVVRDLAWCCFSPELAEPHTHMTGPERLEPSLTTARQRWLDKLAKDPGGLLAYVASRHEQRLGHYFESLWRFFLLWDEEYELLAHNLPVRDAGRTIGEFDILCFSHRLKRHIHLELAVKFYLGYENRWLGPNVRDRLDLKLAHLTQHQLRLGEQPAAAPALDSLGIDRLQTRLVMKGRLFRPLPDLAASMKDAPADGAAGFYWLPVGALASTTPAPHDRFAILGRRLWFAPVSPADNLDRLDSAALRAELEARLEPGARPIQVAVLDPGGVETSRVFVTPDDWPRPLH